MTRPSRTHCWFRLRHPTEPDTYRLLNWYSYDLDELVKAGWKVADWCVASGHLAAEYQFARNERTEVKSD